MIKHNIDFIELSLRNGRPVYGILSMVADTFDTVRTNYNDQPLTQSERQAFDGAMAKVVAGMRDLDSLLKL